MNMPNTVPSATMITPAVARNCWFLTGPTASGKTTIGLELARALDAEIISLDSMAVYRDMDIGTAKPTREQRERVPHHLIDVVDANQTFSVSDFLEGAGEAERQIRQRGKQVLFVGGTPLYLKCLLRGMFTGPPGDETFRRQILEEAAEVGSDALHQRLQLVDPLSAAKLHPHDLRRIVRALEVYRMTGQPISHQQLQFDDGAVAAECRVFVLDWPRPLLHERIRLRVAQMYQEGLVEEVARLLKRFGSLSKTASQAVGYQEVIHHLQAGTSRSEVMERTEVRTRQFAKRQMTWFRSLSECRWIARDGNQTVAELVQQMLSAGQHHPRGTLPTLPNSLG